MSFAGRQARYSRSMSRALSNARCLVLAAGCLLAACSPEPLPRGDKVLLIGIDGASWTVLGPLLDRGELPAFQHLVEHGAGTTSFGVVHPFSPIAWTTVATGRKPADHGILDFVTTLPDGSKVPVASTMRKQKALWELAGEHGRTAGVIGWWASWPAEEIDGYVVSDHADPALVEARAASGKYLTADPADLAALGRDVHPPELGPALQELWLPAEPFDLARLGAEGGFSEAQLSQLQAAAWHEASTYSVIKDTWRSDRSRADIAVHLQGTHPVDLAMIYLRAVDPVQHLAWDLVQPEAYQVPNPHLERDRGVVEAVYRTVDRFLADILATADAHTWVIVASDHGAEPNQAATGPVRQDRPGGHTRMAKGVLWITGPGVRAGARVAASNQLDLLPTAAWLLGLPLSDELPGRVLEEAFEPRFVEQQPRHRVASYGPRPTTLPAASGQDAALLEDLRALGYIE